MVELYLQMKLLLPDRIEVAVDRLGPLFGFTHLDGHVGVTGAGLIFSLQPLSTDNYNRDRVEDGKSSRYSREFVLCTI